MRAICSLIILVIHMAPCIFSDCPVNFDGGSKTIEELISTQGYFCSISVKILKKENVTHYCDRLALLYEVDGLLGKLQFIEYTSNYKKKNNLIDTYKDCILEEEEIEPDEAYAYLQTAYLSPIEILKRVNESLHKLDEFKPNPTSSLDCKSYYKNRQDTDNVSKGPQCACPSPTAPMSSSDTSQTSVNLSEFASSTYTTSSSFHTSHLAEDKYISSNSQGLDSSPVTFTDMPSDLKPPTTIVDHSYATTTVQHEASTGIYTSSYVSLNPAHTRTDPEQVNKDTSDTEGMYESVLPPTVETPTIPTYSLINGEFSTVMEPDEIQETTMSEFSLQSSKGSLFQNALSVPSKEPDTDTSKSVTIKRRSLANMDAFSRAAVKTQALSSLPTSASDPNLLFLKSVPSITPSSGMGLSDTKAPEPVSQVIGDRNLGWASSYLSSTMLTTKTELSMSSPVPGGQRFLSDVTDNPVLNAHKSYNILPQQMRNIANDDRQNGFSGPIHSSNLLPIIATAEGGKQIEPPKQQIILPTVIAVFSVVLALLFLCGLLHYRHRYLVLRRRLNMNSDLDLTNPGAVIHEERVPLPIIQCDTV